MKSIMVVYLACKKYWEWSVGKPTWRSPFEPEDAIGIHKAALIQICGSECMQKMQKRAWNWEMCSWDACICAIKLKSCIIFRKKIAADIRKDCWKKERGNRYITRQDGGFDGYDRFLTRSCLVSKRDQKSAKSACVSESRGSSRGKQG